MVRLTTVYDKEINEKVFFVRGDEAYARTTDTLLEIVEYTNSANSIEGYRVGIKYNVLRDIGSSTIVLYDNDTVLGMYDRDDDDGETTIGSSSSGGFLLSYGDTHNLRMEYKGNSQCIGSKSKTIVFKKDVPNAFKTTLSFNNSTQSTSTLSLSVDVRVNNAVSSVTKNRDVLIYVDGEYKTTITTNNSSTATGTISNLSEGLHTVQAVVEYDTGIRYGEATQIVKVGYLLEIFDYPQTFVNGVDNTVKVSLYDWDGEPVADASISLMNTSSTTNSDGVATFTYTSVTENSYSATYGAVTSDAVAFKSFTPSTLTLTSEDGVMGYNTSEEFTATVTGTGTKENVPISIDGTTIYTDSNGTAKYMKVGNKNPTSAVASTITATCGTLSKTANYDVVYQYVNLPSVKINESYNTLQGTVYNRYALYEYSMKPYDDVMVVFPRPTAQNCSLEFKLRGDTDVEFSYGTAYPSQSVLDSFDYDGTLSYKEKTFKITYTSSAMKLYIDGDLVSTETTTVSSTSPSAKYLFLWFGNQDRLNKSVMVNNIKFMGVS